MDGNCDNFSTSLIPFEHLPVYQILDISSVETVQTSANHAEIKPERFQANARERYRTHR